jgi:inhibitor of cysteine peptidase
MHPTMRILSSCLTASIVLTGAARLSHATGDVVLTQGDDGSHVTLTQGQRLIVQLPGNPSTGYQWKVTRTDRTFGYPEQSFLPGSGAGAAGTAQLVWRTDHPFPMTGMHRVELAYQRTWEPTAIATFSFTVTIEPASVPELVLGPEASGSTVEVPIGARLTVALPSNPSTGYQWIAAPGSAFGAPEQVFIPDDGGAGSGGVTRSSWSAISARPLSEVHHISLEYRRPWELDIPPLATFTLHVRLVEAR